MKFQLPHPGIERHDLQPDALPVGLSRIPNLIVHYVKISAQTNKQTNKQTRQKEYQRPVTITSHITCMTGILEKSLKYRYNL